jgi:exonuclease SbcD
LRVLHTGDWHVGRTLHRRQRLEEAAAVLTEVVEIAERETVDLVLVCGDLFEHHAPSAEAERIVYSTLLALRRSGAEVVVVPGNHDNAKRFRAIEEVFAAAHVHVVPDVRRPAEGGVVEIEGRDGVRAQVACLPWVPERLMFGAEEMMGLQPEPYQAYAEQFPRLVSALCAGLDDAAVTVLAGHAFVSGARLGGGERELTIGQIFAISPATLPTSVQYIALGHVHRPQDIPGAATPARYAGSLLQLDFGEVDQEKSVTIIDLAPGKPARTSTVPITRGRRLVELHGTLDELEAMRPEHGDAWFRVTLVCDGPRPGLADRVREVLPDALEVRLDYERDDPERRASDLRRLTPGELFEHYYRTTHGTLPSGEVATLFAELYEEVTGAAA